MNEPSGEDKAPPALSVVIVAYNSGATLGRCVAALAAQTFDDFELLIVDNDSPQGEAVPAAANLVTLGHQARINHLGIGFTTERTMHNSQAPERKNPGGPCGAPGQAHYRAFQP